MLRITSITTQSKCQEVLKSLLLEEYDKLSFLHFDNKGRDKSSGLSELDVELKEKISKTTMTSLCECGLITFVDLKENEVNEDNPASSVPSQTGQLTKTEETPKIEATSRLNTDTELSNMVAASKNFGEFSEKLAHFLEIPQKRISAFVGLMNAASELSNKKISWKELLAKIEEKGYSFNTTDKKIIVEATTAKLGIPFLKLVSEALIASSSLQNSEKELKQSAPETSQNPEETAKTEPAEVSDRPPYVSIFKNLSLSEETCHLEEIKRLEASIQQIDKSLPLAEKIKAVLEVLGEEELIANPEFIQFTEKAIKLPKISYNTDYFSIDEKMMVMKWNKVCSRLSKIYTDGKPYVPSSVFLTDLREVILTQQQLNQIINN